MPDRTHLLHIVEDGLACLGVSGQVCVQAGQRRTCSMSLNMSGSTKDSSDHSSESLFCSGVPDSSRRRRAPSVPSASNSTELVFLRRCASSTTR